MCSVNMNCNRSYILMLRPFFPDLVMSTDLLSFEYPSVRLFCLTVYGEDVHNILTNSLLHVFV